LHCKQGKKVGENADLSVEIVKIAKIVVEIAESMFDFVNY
jgi:hypothetical protein